MKVVLGSVKVESISSVLKLAIGTLFASGLYFVTLIFVARSLSVEEYGLFVSYLTVGLFYASFVSFGVSGYALQNEVKTNEFWLLESLLPVVINAIVGIVVLYMFAEQIEYFDVLLLLLLASLALVFLDINICRFQVRGQYSLITRNQILLGGGRFVAVGLTVLALQLFKEDVSIVSVSASFFLGSTVYIGTNLRSAVKFSKLLLRYVIVFRAIGVMTGLLKRYSKMLHFYLASFYVLIYMQSDIVILKYLTSEEETGLYASAYTLITATFLLPTVLNQKYLLPKIIIFSQSNLRLMFTNFKLSFFLMTFSGVTAGIILYIFSDILIPSIFGVEYENSINLLKVLAISVPCYYIASSFGLLLSLKAVIRYKSYVMLLAAVSNVILNIVMIQEYGALGAAYSTLVSVVVLLIGYCLGVLIYFNVRSKVYLF